MKLATTTLLAAALVGMAVAQGTVLYAPSRVIGEQGISVTGWGSGTIAETDETAFEGVHSIRISSRNYFQGGVMNYERPVDLAQAFGDKASLLRIVYKAPTTSSVSGGGGLGGGGKAGIGGGGGAAGGGVGAGPGSGGRPGQGGVGAGPGGGAGVGAGPGGQGGGTVQPLETLRVIVGTSDGKKSEAYIPVRSAIASAAGWSTVAVPLQAINGFDRTNKIVKSIAFAPDTTTTLYVGDLRVIEDTTPLRGEISPQSLNLGANQEVRLVGSGTGGASILKYSWDFDDSDGIQEDAVGQAVNRKFRKPGSYTITLTISDHFGLKQPYQTTIKAVVNG